MKSNYLKYWRVIRHWIKVRYGIGQADLEMLIFLYDESYFGKDKFREFNELISWDEKRFDRMLRDGWIENFRAGTRKKKGIYSLTFKSKKMIASMYSKINGEEIPMNATNNPMFKKRVKYTDKVYRNFIKAIHAETRGKSINAQEPHPVPE